MLILCIIIQLLKVLKKCIKEIETCPPNNLFNVLSKRLNDIPIKLADILKNNEKYTLICLYYKIYSNFITNQNAGNNPKLFFQRKDVNSRLKISDFDFQDVHHFNITFT